MSTGAKSPAFITTCVVIGFGIFALMSESQPISGAFFFVPFSLGPLFISLILAFISPIRSCQTTLVVGSLLYAAWFGFVFLNAFYLHLDPQSAIALLFVGIYSLPVMMPIWLVTFALKHHNKNQVGEQDGTSNGG